MAFDPIRDAMLSSSPKTQKMAGMHSAFKVPTMPAAPPLVIPTSTSRQTSPSTASTTPRATSLAMLLNDSTTYRSSPSPSSTSRPTPGSGSGFPFNLLTNPVSPTIRSQEIPPAAQYHRPPPKMRSPSPPQLPVTPYDPDRISKPRSLLVPLTPSERHTFANPSNSLRRALALKAPASKGGDGDRGSYSPSQPQSSSRRAYSPSEQQGDSDYYNRDIQRKRKRSPDRDQGFTSKSKRANDELLVARHYNERREVGVAARKDSVIFGLKAFNNWIKSVLIQKMAYEPLSRSSYIKQSPRGSRLSGRVLDIGVGKGGDLQKWQKARIREYVALDVADVSVEQAKGRWKKMSTDKFDAIFAALDCYTYPISHELSPNQLAEPFDVVSMQFCMHYAFETEQKVRTMLDNVSRYLKPGGRFIGTTPNAEILFSSLAEQRQNDPDALSFGNSVYRVTFDSYQGPLYGHRYVFHLEDAVENVPEYVVYWDSFVELAGTYGLRLVYKKEFHEVFQEEQDSPEFGPLLKRLGVVNNDDETSMDEDQWEAANVYLAFAFQKFDRR